MRLSRFSVLVAACAAAVGIACPGALAAPAATDRYVAPTGSDTGDCTSQSQPCKTIGYAVGQAADGDTVHVAAGHYAESVQVTKSITIAGAGASSTVVSGSATGPAFFFGAQESTLTDTLRDISASDVVNEAGIIGFGVDLTMTDAAAGGNSGVGLALLASALTATGSSFSHNAVASGNGIGSGVGVELIESTATITDTAIDDNGFAGITEENDLRAGVVRSAAAADSDAALTITDSSVSGNGGPGLGVAGSPTLLTNDTFADNEGAGVFVENTTASLTGVTITGTTAYSGMVTGVTPQAGIVLASQPQEEAVRASYLTRTPSRFLARVTRHLGLAAHGFRASAVSASPDPTAPAATVAGSIDAKNTVADCSAAITSAGYNLSSDKANSCGLSTKDHDLIRTDPELGPLGIHGGTTQTVLPLKGSPAIDAVPAGKAGCSTSATDQRGVARPQPAGGNCDIGAVELAAEKLTITTTTLPGTTVGAKYSQQLSATGGQYPTYIWAHVSGTLPPGLALSSTGVISGRATTPGTYTFTVSVNDPVVHTYTIVVTAVHHQRHKTIHHHHKRTHHVDNQTTHKLANTGLPTEQLLTFSAWTILGGLALLVAAGLLGRRSRRRSVG